MNYPLVKDVVDLVCQFDQHNEVREHYPNTIDGFKSWIQNEVVAPEDLDMLHWEGKNVGRSVDSLINTLLVHLNRYAKGYSKSAINGSDFSTQEEFIYLISLKSFGAITKMELVKLNVHDKPTGIQIINRLITNKWVEQKDSLTDKRTKVIQITPLGLEVLAKQMPNIRKATQVVGGNLNEGEKIELARLLSKLSDFHHPIYQMNLDNSALLEKAFQQLTKAAH